MTEQSATGRPGLGRRPHATDELAFAVYLDGDDLRGEATLTPHAYVPGTDVPRITVLTAWADYTVGALAVSALAPRMPVTLELSVHLYPEAAGLREITWKAEVVKAGRTVVVLHSEFRSPHRRPVGFANALFVAGPDPGSVGPTREHLEWHYSKPRQSLTQPLATMLGCQTIAPGHTVLPCAPHILNTSGAINGGLIAIAVEEAALSADPGAAALESVQLRYLRGVHTGPATAEATVRNGIGQVDVRDSATGKLAVVATTRAADAHRS